MQDYPSLHSCVCVRACPFPSWWLCPYNIYTQPVFAQIYLMFDRVVAVSGILLLIHFEGASCQGSHMLPPCCCQLIPAIVQPYLRLVQKINGALYGIHTLVVPPIQEPFGSIYYLCIIKLILLCFDLLHPLKGGSSHWSHVCDPLDAINRAFGATFKSLRGWYWSYDCCDSDEDRGGA